MAADGRCAGLFHRYHEFRRGGNAFDQHGLFLFGDQALLGRAAEPHGVPAGLNRQGDQFDAVMNYHFTRPCLAFFGAHTLDHPMNEQSGTVSQAAKLSPEELKGKLVVGCLKNEPRDDYYTEYARIIEAQKVED